MCQTIAEGGRRCAAVVMNTSTVRKELTTLSAATGTHNKKTQLAFAENLHKARRDSGVATEQNAILTALAATKTQITTLLPTEDANLPDLETSSIVRAILSGATHTPDFVENDDPYHAGAFQNMNLDNPITPLPERVNENQQTGTVIVLASGETKNGTVTFHNYATVNGGTQLVMFADVHDEYEANILEKLNVPIKTKKWFTPPHPDSDPNNVTYNILTEVTETVNETHLNTAPLPQNVIEKVNKLWHDMTTAETTQTTSPEVVKMFERYRPRLVKLRSLTENWGDTLTTEHAIVKMMPLKQYWPNQPIPETKKNPASLGGFPTETIQAYRHRLTEHPTNGTTLYTGQKITENIDGLALEVALPNGYTALYCPPTHNTTEEGYLGSPRGMRGQLTVTAPPGANDPQGMLQTFQHLGLNPSPATGRNVEMSYLRENIRAAGHTSHPAVVAANADNVTIVETYQHQKIAELTQTVDISNVEVLQKLITNTRIEAETETLPLRVQRLREAAATAAGYSTGDELLNHHTYKPLPSVTKALRWRRYTTLNETPTENQYRNMEMDHCPAGGYESLLTMLRTGTMESSTTRSRTGTEGKDSSQREDLNLYDGSRQLYFCATRTGERSWWAKRHEMGVRMVFSSEQLLTRTDVYGHNGDHFGAGPYSKNKNVINHTTPKAILDNINTDDMNEILCYGEIDLFGPDAPKRIELYGKEVLRNSLTVLKETHGYDPTDLHPTLGIPFAEWFVLK
jgi:hypothetical protein